MRRGEGGPHASGWVDRRATPEWGCTLREVGQEFLLGFAGVSATLLGTFLVAVFFYLDSEAHRKLAVSEAADLYVRSGVRWVFTAYAVPLFVALVLATLPSLWAAAVFVALMLILVLMSVDTARRILVRGGSGASRALVANEWLTNTAVVVAAVLPWLLGGWTPPPAAYIPSLLLLLASGFASTAALAMAQFDATMGTPPGQPYGEEPG